MEKKRFIVNGKTYAVPDDGVPAFLKKFPKARECHKVEEDALTGSSTGATKAAKLYESLIAEGSTVENLGTEREFIYAIENKGTAQSIYNALKIDGYTKDNIGREIQFMKTFVKGWGKINTIYLTVYRCTQKISSQLKKIISAARCLNSDD